MLVEAVQDQAARLSMLNKAVQDEGAMLTMLNEAVNTGRGHPG